MKKFFDFLKSAIGILSLLDYHDQTEITLYHKNK